MGFLAAYFSFIMKLQQCYRGSWGTLVPGNKDWSANEQECISSQALQLLKEAGMRHVSGVAAQWPISLKQWGSSVALRGDTSAQGSGTHHSGVHSGRSREASSSSAIS